MGEEARDLTMTEWIRHCAELLGSNSIGVRAKAALTLEVNDFFHHETWTSVLPPSGTGPGGTDLPGTNFLPLVRSDAGGVRGRVREIHVSR